MHISMTTVVIAVTREHIKRLVERNREHSNKTKQTVLNVIRQNGEPISPRDIKKLLYAGIHSQLSREYEEGKFGRQEFHKKLKEQTIDIRTIHRKLSALVREGVLKREHGNYELTVKAKSDMRYFASEFGIDALNVLMKMYHPGENSIEQNISLMSRLFGAYILFCFMETARPVGSTQVETPVYGLTNRDMVASCLQNIIQVKNMFDYFISVLDYLLSDNKTRSYKYNIEKIYTAIPEFKNKRPKDKLLDAVEIAYLDKKDTIEKAKPRMLALERTGKEMEKKFKEGRLTYAEVNHYYYLTSEDPFQYKIDQNKLEVFAKAFSKVESEVYEELGRLVLAFKENPKKKMTDLMDKWQPLY